MEALNLDIRQPLPIIIDGEEYKLEWPFKHIPELEKRVGRPMRQAIDWFFVKPEEFRYFVAVGLLANHSEENIDALAYEVGEVLEADVEASALFREQLLECNWPRAKAKAEEALRVALEMEKRGIDPKAQSADAR